MNVQPFVAGSYRCRPVVPGGGGPHADRMTADERPVRRRDAAATRAAILRAAREAFTAHGYAGAGVR